MRGLLRVHELISSEAITGSGLFDGASYSECRAIQGNTVVACNPKYYY